MKKTTPTPHDALFKQFLTHPETAKDLLDIHLPAELREICDLTTLKLESGSLRFHLEQGSDFSWLATAIAGWMRYVSGVDEQGNEIDVRDPMADTLRQICDQHGLNVSVVPALLAVEAIFPAELGQTPQVIDAVSSAYQSLIEHGAVATVAAL